ncbi:MAG TPA: hypothetical protein VIY49_13060 [Bryobacteraceae bacterium]
MDYSEYYRSELPFMALDDHHATVTIPRGKLIRVIGAAEDDRFLEIEMDGERLQAFEVDLKNRCSVHPERGPAKASLSANASF